MSSYRNFVTDLLVCKKLVTHQTGHFIIGIYEYIDLIQGGRYQISVILQNFPDHFSIFHELYLH